MKPDVLAPTAGLATLARGIEGLVRPNTDALSRIYTYAWGNNARRAQLKGRRCVVEARGTKRTVLVRFLDNGQRVTTSARALRGAK